jgi:hypothetical protein
LAIIFVILAVESGNLWWLLLLSAPAALLIRGRYHLVEAAATLVQAIVLKMVEPPVLVRYREVVAKAEQERKRAEEERKTANQA